MNSSVKDAVHAFDGLRAMFYAITPAESYFETVRDVPDYVHQATLFFFMFVICEYIYLRRKNGPDSFRANAGFSSMSAGMVMRCFHVLMKNWEIGCYVWLHENFSVVDLPWNSAWTWFACFLGVDLLYYWFHRMAHEVNFMWAAHQVHHSSEDYNLATSLRQSAFQQCSSWLFYLPLALVIPSPMFITHIQFNLLYQFWIHTEVIGKLGPLEWVLNTASHHRVHHGRNRYCIDKNYAGTLIIWDRIFGTFVPEGEKVVYGLTHTLETFDPVRIQMCHYMYMLDLLRQSKSLSEAFGVIFKGPGWGPGKPRLGLIEDIPDVHAPVPRYDPHVSKWLQFYMIANFIVVFLCFEEFYMKRQVFNCFTVGVFIMYILLCLTAIGTTFDKKSCAPCLHLASHIGFLVGQHILEVNNGIFTDKSNGFILLKALQVYAVLSTLFWIPKCLSLYSNEKYKIK